MTQHPGALEVLLQENADLHLPLTPELVQGIYGIEERAQFDSDRRDAVLKIRALITAALDSEVLEESTDGHAS